MLPDLLVLAFRQIAVRDVQAWSRSNAYKRQHVEQMASFAMDGFQEVRSTPFQLLEANWLLQNFDLDGFGMRG